MAEKKTKVTAKKKTVAKKPAADAAKAPAPKKKSLMRRLIRK